MTLLNLADIEFWQGSLTTEAAYRYRRWRLEAEAGFTQFGYKVKDTLNFLPLALYQEQYAGGIERRRDFPVYHTKAGVGYTWGPHQITLTVRYGTRAPNHHELYAYYLYVPMDNSILMGNSLLWPERLLRGELMYHHAADPVAWQMSVFGNYLSDYISPVTFMRPGAPGNSTLQHWRILRNTGNAYTVGATVQGSWHLTKDLLAEFWSGYTYGWHESLQEPLPWIYPLFGRVRLTQTWRRHRAGIELYGAAAQAHLSRTIYIEDYTPAYLLVHVRYGYQLLAPQEGRRVGLTLAASVENLLDTYGWDHLSVGNMPFLGRVLRTGVLVQW